MNRCKDRLYVGVLWSLIALLDAGAEAAVPLGRMTRSNRLFRRKRSQ